VLRRTGIAVAVFATTAALSAVPALAAQPASAGHDTVTHGMLVRDSHSASKGARPTRSSLLTYHGGATGLAHQVVIVYWGSQWGPGADTALPDATHDPAGEAPLQLRFFQNITASAWDNSTGQYCAGSDASTVLPFSNNTACNGPKPVYSSTLVARTWLDNSVAAPSRPTQSQLAAEAVHAAQTLGTGTAVQYVIDTATGNNASGFGTQYCAWHSSTSYSAGQVAYTNMPYVSDAGASCGAGFVSVGSSGVDPATEGVTIVGGHEWAETVTDDYPNGGWLDGSGAENGDKCAWITAGKTGASHLVSTSAGSFAVQSLWSNANNNCVG
jgi:hypothetical protein